MSVQSCKFNLVEQSTPILMWLWAIWFFSYDYLRDTGHYEYLDLLPNWVWGTIFMSVGLLKCYSILYSKYAARRAAAAGSVILWGVLCAIFFEGNSASHLVPSTAFFAFQSVLSWYRISKLTSKA